jgi:23S rRNA (uracil747-C5)-methyltransferase
MVVAGTLDEPTLGILDPAGAGVDLQGCGLYPPVLAAAFAPLAAFVTRAGLTPYDVPARRGELKSIVATVSPDGELMVRFVLRSTEAVARVSKHLPWLLEQLTRLAVVSVNLLPEHKAVVEGDREIVLTERETLRMNVNGIDLHLRPQSFFQTNTAVAAALYREATAWIAAADPALVWDLYCGVGGFALHAIAPGRSVVGVETSREAVASASISRDELAGAGVPGAASSAFLEGDAMAYAASSPSPPDLVVVNPPRRGLGPELSGWLEGSGVATVIYSSCNPETLARDLAAMPSLRPTRARLFDMFPQTSHGEIAVLLERA